MAKLAIVAGWRAAKANGWEYPIVMPRESCQTDARMLDATDFDHADEVNPDACASANHAERRRIC